MKNFIDKYFTDTKEYPSNISEDLLPIGTFWSYISNTFLNGFINYVKPVKQFVLGRYLGWNEFLDNEPFIKMEGRLNSTTKYHGTKEDLYELMINAKESITNNLHAIEDDICILAKSQGNGKYWWVFWFDCDCSDGCIGRFETVQSDEIVIDDFTKWVMDKTHDYSDVGDPRELPLYCFENEWVEFK